MTLRELSKYYKLHRRLEENKQILSALYKAAGLGAQEITGTPRAPGVRDTVGDLIIEIGDLQSRIECLESKCAEEKKKLEKYISTIKDDHTRMIFRLRFLHCMTWAQVAETIGGRNTASGVRAICYRYLKNCSGANTCER